MEIVNSCETNNGGCSHLCRHTSSGPVCACNLGYQLDEDQKTCIGNPITDLAIGYMEEGLPLRRRDINLITGGVSFSVLLPCERHQWGRSHMTVY